MKIGSLSQLASCASMIFGRALPTEFNPMGKAQWSGRRADEKTPEMREALSALDVLYRLYADPKTKLSACVLYYAFVRHGHEARSEANFLPTLALTLTPPAKPPKMPLTGAKLLKWQTKGFDLIDEAIQVFERA